MQPIRPPAFVRGVELGLGLIGIGRPWGQYNAVVPGEEAAIQLLERSIQLGIRYLDTAPSYGLSELRLGRFLTGLSKEDRAGLIVATKWGEHWDQTRGEPFEDHSFDALRRSLDRSVGLLGRIEVLQLHKTTPEVLRRPDLDKAWQYARELGVQVIGTSVKDEESARLTLEEPRYGLMQLPFNRDSTQFSGVIRAADDAGVAVVVNRPFAMGRMLGGEHPVGKRELFQFVLSHRFRGVVLTGTKSATHLEENAEAFKQAFEERKWQARIEEGS